MGPAFSWFLGLRYLVSRWVNVLGIVGVTLAVAALIVVRGVFSGFIADIRTEVRRSTPDLLLTGLPHGTGFEQLRSALADADVRHLAPRLRHYGVFYQRAGSLTVNSAELEFSNVDNSFVQLLGIDQEREADTTPFDDWLARGRRRDRFDLGDRGAPELGPMLQVPSELEYFARRRLHLPVPARPSDHVSLWPGLLLGKDRARRQPGLAVGEPLDVVSVDFAGTGRNGRERALALQMTFAFAGAFRTGARLFDDTTAIVPIESLRTMLGHDAADSGSIDLVTDVAIRARDGMTTAELAALAARLLPAVLAALPVPLPAEARPEVLTWEQQNAVFLDAVETERAMMTAVLFAVMLIAAFLIFATLHMMVTQKIKDIGIVTALGGSPRGTGRIFLYCGVVIGAAGALAGMALGIVALRYLNPANDWLLAHVGISMFPPDLFDLQQIPYRIDGDWVLSVGASAFALTLLVAWWPARKAARMHPVAALAHE